MGAPVSAVGLIIVPAIVVSWFVPDPNVDETRELPIPGITDADATRPARA